MIDVGSCQIFFSRFATCTARAIHRDDISVAARAVCFKTVLFGLANDMINPPKPSLCPALPICKTPPSERASVRAVQSNRPIGFCIVLVLLGCSGELHYDLLSKMKTQGRPHHGPKSWLNNHDDFQSDQKSISNRAGHRQGNIAFHLAFGTKGQKCTN